jgi:hypothetical protein
LVNGSTLVPLTTGQQVSFVDDSIPTQTSNQAFTYYVTAVSDTDGNLLESAPSNMLSLTSFGAPGSPVITVPAAASPSEVTGTTAILSVTATSLADPDEIVYSWATIGTPPAPVQFSPNIDDPNNTWTATFTQAETYTLRATATDDLSHLASTSDVTVTVQQTATSINITPATANVPLSTGTQTSTQQFTGQILDQFGNTMAGTIAWSDTGGGQIGASSGLYTAPTFGSTDTVTATEGGVSGSAEISLSGIESGQVIAVPQATNIIYLSWPSVAGATGYLVYRSTAANFTPSYDNLVGGPSDPELYDDTLTGGTQYYYQVFATLADGTLLKVGTATAQTNASDPSSPAQPTGVQAMGVNDLEVLVTWTSNHDADYYILEESTDGTTWYDVAETTGAASNCLVRGCGLGGSNFLQEGVTYQFRVVGVDTLGYPEPLGATNALLGQVSASVPPSVQPPPDSYDDGGDTVVIVGGRNDSIEDLLGGISIQNTASGPTLVGQSANDSVGMVWADLVNAGFNVYISADPEDGGSYNTDGTSGGGFVMPDGGTLQSVLNNDASGRLYDEINYEINDGSPDVGLIGYSHGAGMTENISNRLWADSSTPWWWGGVVFADTIDGIEYGTYANGWTDPLEMSDSPADQWGGQGKNYYEDYGPVLHGQPLAGAVNVGPLSNETHSSMGRDHVIRT